MAKMSIIFKGFTDLAADIDRAGGDLKTAVNDALVQTQGLIQSNLASAAAVYASKGRKGYATGKMYGTIIDDHVVDWSGSIATVRVGFDLGEDGGFHSIFIMYGTAKMSKDVAVYNAIKGTATKNAIALLQEDIMKKYLKLGE